MNKPKLRPYVTFKQSIELEDYIHFHLHRRKRSLLAKLRLSILPLQVVTGRYDNTPLDNRLCKLCNLYKIEDEKHFITECPTYSDHITELYNAASLKIRNFNEYNNDEKFTNLLKYCFRPLAEFVDKAFTKRKSQIFQGIM